MAIEKIKIKNFKSFKELELDLGKFNVLIGANASGKSNFVEIFRFLKNITEYGLENAISMEGGVEFLRNINIGSSENFSLSIVSNETFPWPIFNRREFSRRKRIIINKITYEFALEFAKKGTKFKIAEDKTTYRYTLEEEENKKRDEGKFTISSIKGKLNLENFESKNGILKESEVLPINFIEHFLKPDRPNKILLEGSHFPIIGVPEYLLGDISIYDFDPKMSKQPAQITGKTDLEENGSNLSIVLKNILDDKEESRKFFNLITNILPFVEKLDIDKIWERSLLFELKETYSSKKFLPASFLSDGTINISALIVALYFGKKSSRSHLTIIEEPERNIHPYLISKMINMMKDASSKKQIIVTTHNPEVIKHVGKENILLVSRDKEGFSKISKPAEKEEIKTFLQNEIGIEELYVQNLLEF